MQYGHVVSWGIHVLQGESVCLCLSVWTSPGAFYTAFYNPIYGNCYNVGKQKQNYEVLADF